MYPELKKLQYLRKLHAYTCREVGEKIGMSKVYYWQIEHGDRRLSYKNAEKIARFFQMNPDELFYYDFLDSEYFSSLI